MSIRETKSDEICDFLSVDMEKVDRIRRSAGINLLSGRMAEIFKVLSDPTRLKIVQALEMDELCVCDIAALMGLSQPSVSHHLKILRQSGVVKYRRSGKMAIYSVKDSHISALLAVARDHAKEHV
jgi:DNA-binding transcriptional ArsR family regulator